jgi:lysophospholipase L1-like esterase
MRTRLLILTLFTFHFSLFTLPFSLPSATAQTLTFPLGDDRVVTTPLPDTLLYNSARGYGWDFTRQLKTSHSRFLSVAVPDGNYRVSVTLGSKKKAGSTTLRAESRRLMAENVPTRKGETKTVTFLVNKRDTKIRTEHGEEEVRIKQRERSKLNWDDKLTLEITGDAPQVKEIRIEPAGSAVTTLYLCGNSTVVDQDYEPWASWGQMITRWMDDGVAVANYAESGESASTFIAAGRFKKIVSLLHEGDYVFIEFGHNDQKQKFPGAGAYYNFATCLKQMVDEVRGRGATPVFVTPTQRRSFDDEGKIRETHADYPEAMRWVARREQVQVIELHDRTRTFFEQLGVEGSKQALVHYPANTYPGQFRELADNTHFNTYGAYEVAKMVVEGIRTLQLPLAGHVRSDYVPFSPLRPDPVESFHWTDSPFFEGLKPDGN